MKNKNGMIFLILIMMILVVGCNNSNNEIEIKSDKLYTNKDINPISKESVMNILRAEYGEDITTTINEIEPVGDYYVVEVYIELKESNDNEENENSKDVHRESLGEHKIDMYTGELFKSE